VDQFPHRHQPPNKINDVINRYGLPTGDFVMQYSNHVLQYDTARKIPKWVLEHMSKDDLKGHAERSQCNFKVDQSVPKQFRSHNEDYLGSGFARGHMVPASDVKKSQESMQETFYLTNILPQDFDNNGGFWYRMENYCRSLTNRFTDVYVISGPLFLSHFVQNKKMVTFQVIGDNNVAVPSHLFKIILVENHGRPIAAGAFVVPNAPIADDKVLTDYQVSLSQIENMTGFMFFPKIDMNNLPNLCSRDNCQLLTKNMADLNILMKNLKRVRSKEELDNLWNQVLQKNVQLDQKFMQMYWEKRKTYEKDN